MVAPTEMVTSICELSTGTVDRATSALHLSDVCARMSFVMPGRITKNSSPPQRPSTSDARKQPERVFATVTSAASPAKCP